MKKMIPFEVSMTETYNCYSFIMGILQSYDNFKQHIWNTFLNLQSCTEKSMKELKITFTDSLWGDMWNSGMAELNLFHFSNFDRKTLKNFLTERLDSDAYLLFYSVDEYYLSYSEKYRKQHYYHDLYIYGYEDDYFFVLAYADNKLEKLKVKSSEIIDCVLKTKMDSITDFCSFRLSKAANIVIDPGHIADVLEDYLLSQNHTEEQGKVYGMEVWRYVRNSVSSYAKRNIYDSSTFDLRVFRIIWEHKKIMKARIEYLCEDFNFEERILSELNEIESRAYLAFRLAIKYSVDARHSSECLVKILQIYEELEEKERAIYPEIIKELRREADDNKRDSENPEDRRPKAV